ncbi:MAG: hypothetical protein NT154_04035 [Verrucomicrobia bacterium]|nr:hypothetical protein [Verrucomicrobiota bacterium]
MSRFPDSALLPRLCASARGIGKNDVKANGCSPKRGREDVMFLGDAVHPSEGFMPAKRGFSRRLEFEMEAWFEGACGFALVLALSQMTEHGLGPFGYADLHPRRSPFDRQGRFAP